MPLIMNYAFVALWAAWLLFWIGSAFGNKRTLRSSGARWRLVSVAAVAAVWFVLRQFRGYLDRPLFPSSAAWTYIGLVLTACGLAFTVWARLVLGPNWSGMPTIKQDHELIERGPYGLVRHPIYTGLLLAVFGSALAGGHAWNVAVFAMITILLIVKSKAEEALLSRQFPDAYRDYRQRVKALIPFVY